MHPTQSTPANRRREVPFPAIASPQPKRKRCHPKGRNEVENVRSTLTPLVRRLRSALIPPTDSPEDPQFERLRQRDGVCRRHGLRSRLPRQLLFRREEARAASDYADAEPEPHPDTRSDAQPAAADHVSSELICVYLPKLGHEAQAPGVVPN